MINAKFINCLFEYGTFKENTTDDMSCSLTFMDCTFFTGKPFDLTGVRGNANRGIWLHNCWLYGDWVITNANIKLQSTHASGTGATIEFIDSKINQGRLNIGGDWNYTTTRMHITDNTNTPPLRNIFDTSGYVHLFKSILANGIHFASDPGDKVIHECNFNDTLGNAISGGDITADITIPIVDYVSNIQQNGLSGDIQIIDPIKPVGANAINRYCSIQDAIDSIATSGFVQLHQNYTGLAELIITDDKTVVVDGGRAYSLTFSADIVELGLNQSLKLARLIDIDGGTIEINGNGAEAHICSCNHTSTYSVLITSGTGAEVHINNSSYTAPTGLSAIQVDSVDPSILVEYSKLIGATGQPAIEFTVLSLDKLKCKFSSIIHGDGGVNEPITYTGAGKVTMRVYGTGLNANWDAADFTNLIGSPNNTTDDNINF